MAGVVLAAGALGVLAGPAQAAVPGCDQLTVESVRDAGGAVALEATVPATLGLVTVPSSAFSYVQDGETLPVSASRREGGDRTVAVVVGRSSASTDDSFRLAVSAVRELVAELPRDARVALVSGVGRAEVLVPLTQDRTATLDALPRLRLEGQADTQAALGLAVAQLPSQGRRHVVVVDADTTSRAALPSGVALHEVGSAASGQGCPASGANGDAIAEVDAVVARMSGEYRLDVPGGRPGGELRLSYLATSSTASASPGATPVAGPAPDGQAAQRDGTPRALSIGLLAAAGALVVLVTTGTAAWLAHRRRLVA